MEEEIKKSVPYQSIKNPKKQYYENSSDENDLDIGFPTLQNKYSYNILRDLKTINKIKSILDASQQIMDYSCYQNLTIFEELKIIIYFAENQNDTLQKKLRTLSQLLQRNESDLSQRIQNISYFQRFTEQNIKTLMDSLKRNINSTLISKIRWKKNKCSTSLKVTTYRLEIEPNFQIENSKQGSKQGIANQNMSDENSDHSKRERYNQQLDQEHNIYQKKKAFQGNVFSSNQIIKQTKKHKSYFDSDSKECEQEDIEEIDEDDNNLLNQNTIYEEQYSNKHDTTNSEITVYSNQFQNIKHNHQRIQAYNYQQINNQYTNNNKQNNHGCYNQNNNNNNNINNNYNNNGYSNDNEDNGDVENNDDDYDDENEESVENIQKPKEKIKNSLNALLAEKIQFEYYSEDQEEQNYSDQMEQNRNYSKEFVKDSKSLNQTKLSFLNDLINSIELNSIQENIKRNQKLSLKSFIVNKN